MYVRSLVDGKNRTVRDSRIATRTMVFVLSPLVQVIFKSDLLEFANSSCWSKLQRNPDETMTQTKDESNVFQDKLFASPMLW